MPTYHNDNGTWREVKELYANDNGTWREIKKGYVNDNGTWRLIHNAEEPIWETSTFRLGGAVDTTVSPNVVTRAGWNSGNLFFSPVANGVVYGSLGDELELANTTISGTIAGNNASSLVWGFSSQYYVISNTNNSIYNGQPNTTNSFPVGSIANSAFTTSTVASGSSKTAGSNLNITQLWIHQNISGSQSSNTIFLLMDTSSNNVSIWPAQHIKISYPSGGFQYHYTGMFFSNEGGRTTSPVVKGTKTAGSFLRNDGVAESNLYNQFNGFSGQNVPIILYDRPYFGFKSSTGGVEYRLVFKLDWDIVSTSNAGIIFVVEGHNLPADAWSRIEINGVSLDVSLFSKSETGGGFSTAYTTWSYVYPGNAKTALGDIEDTVALKLFKEP